MLIHDKGRKPRVARRKASRTYKSTVPPELLMISSSEIRLKKFALKAIFSLRIEDQVL